MKISSRKLIRFIVASILAAIIYLINLDSTKLNSETPNRIRICSQNIYRLGDKNKLNDPQYLKQLNFLVQRIVKADCDILGLQEVSRINTQQILENLSQNISEKTGKNYEIVVGGSNTSTITNAFLISSDDFVIKESKSLHKSSLPKFDPRERPWSFSRGPLTVLLEPKFKNFQHQIFVINDHLKSKSNGWKDKTETQFENLRVLSAAAIKRELLKNRSDKKIEVFLGDRNSSESGASSLILSGRVLLNDFQKGGKCEISKEGSALCPPEDYDSPDMIPILEAAGDKRKVPFYTYKFANKTAIYDEIYVFKEDGHFFQDKLGRFRTGVEGEFKKGSDHLLSWVELSPILE